MTQKVKIEPNKIHLQSVKVTSGNLSTDPEMEKNQISEFRTHFEINYGTAPDDNSVRYIFSVKLEGIDLNGELLPVTAEYKLEYIFMIENLSHFIEKKEDKILLDQSMAATLMGIVYSTTRGIVLSRTQGTIMDGIILPVVDPLQLLMPAQ